MVLVRNETLQTEIQRLREALQLHAGDVMSLSNELDEWRDRALAAEEALALTRPEERDYTVIGADGEIKPHIYMPDYQSMGDCRVCGHEQDKPWHMLPRPDGGGSNAD